MEKLVDGHRRSGYGPEVYHLIAGRVGVEFHPHGVLHPGVGHQYPPRRDGGAQARQPGGSQVEAAAHLLPPEEHHGNKRRLHEEGHNALDGQRRSEDVAHKPAVIAPVGTKLKLQDNARGHADGEVDAEQLHPEAGGTFPEGIARPIIESLHEAHDHGQSQGQRHENPMVDGRQGKLRPRPVNQRRIDVFNHKLRNLIRE